MPFAKSSSGEFQMDPQMVKDQGKTIVSEAQDQWHTQTNNVDQLQKNISQLIAIMPQALYDPLTQFNTNFYNKYTDMLTERIAIGHILQGAASQTEVNEVETANAFTSDSPQALPPPNTP